MARTLTQMTTRVGNMIQDTSSNTATLIGYWINDKYNDISNRILWSGLINNTYTLTTTANLAYYALPSDFESEIFVADVTNGFSLKRYTETEWWKERYTAFQGGSISSGQPNRYYIQRKTSRLYLDPTPNAVITIALPYKVTVSDLGATDASAIEGIDYILECGAAAEGFAYQRNFTKSGSYLQKYEYELNKRISQERGQPNQLSQWIPASRGMGFPTPMTGLNSYDSI